ncbi:MAG: hypothetical protein ACLS9K_14155 [Lachnospira eligens]
MEAQQSIIIVLYNIKFVSEGSVVSEGRYTYGTLMPTPVAYRADMYLKLKPAVTQTVPCKTTIQQYVKEQMMLYTQQNIILKMNQRI